MPLFEVTEYDKKVWEEELKDFMPDKIIDIHTHVYTRKILTQLIRKCLLRCAGPIW